MRHRVSPRLLIGLALLAAAPPPRAAAQARPAPAAAYVADPVTTDLPAGLDAAIPVRIADARTGSIADAVRLVQARLTSPFNAAVPVRVEPGPGQQGVRLFRADLLAPGAWTLELTLATPAGAITRASLGFSVAATPAQALAPDPAGAAAAPLPASVLPLEPAVSTRGPGAIGDAVAPTPSPAGSRAAPSATPASSFCAECAEEAPH